MQRNEARCATEHACVACGTVLGLETDEHRAWRIGFSMSAVRAAVDRHRHAD